MAPCYGIHSGQRVKRITMCDVSPCVWSLLLKFILLLLIHRTPVKPTFFLTHNLLGTINSCIPDSAGSCSNRSTKENLKGETGEKAQTPLTRRNTISFIQKQNHNSSFEKSTCTCQAEQGSIDMTIFFILLGKL